MQQTPITPFIKEDSVSTRREFGSYLDQVEQEKKRFAITKRGKVVALLVPTTDQQAIDEHHQKEELDKMYKAIQSLQGIITDDVTDTSESIDEIVYGQAYDEAQEEANA